MGQGPIIQEVEAPAEIARPTDSRQRILGLVVVLLMSFGRFTLSAFNSAIYGNPVYNSHQLQLGIAVALVAQASSLLLLWFVLSQQGHSWLDIGWNASLSDVMPGIALAVVCLPLALFTTSAFQVIYRTFTGHFLPYRSAHGMLGAGVSVLSIILVLLNPFFEELIVRGYTMTEVAGVTGSQILAILVSVLVQMSYHVYQGLGRCIGLAVTFTIFSIYFSKERRIAPVILAHFLHDAYALFRLSA